MIVNRDGTGLEAELSHASWRKSSYSNNGGNCVEVARLSNSRVAIRDSKAPHQAALIFTEEEFAAFVNSVRSGQLDA